MTEKRVNRETKGTDTGRIFFEEPSERCTECEEEERSAVARERIDALITQNFQDLSSANLLNVSHAAPAGEGIQSLFDEAEKNPGKE